MLALLLYARSVNYSLLWDDPLILNVIRQRVAAKGPLGPLTSDFRLLPQESLGYYRPVVLYSFWIDSLVAKALPQSFHLTNILLHAANTVLVFVLARLILPGVGPAAAAAAIFAAHPVHIESVTFVSGRTDLWVTLFLLLAAVPWLRGRRAQGSLWAGVAWSSLAYGMALLSKESAFVLPAVLLVWEFLLGSATSARGWRRVKQVLPWCMGWLAAAALVLWLRLGWNAIGFGAALTGNSPLTAGAWMVYFKLLWFPWPLIPYYLFPPGAVPLLGAVAGMGATLALCASQSARKWSRVGVLGLAWLALFLVPVAGVVPLRGAVIAQRFLYLPSVGFCLVAGLALWRIIGKENLGKVGIPAALAALAVLSLLTVRGMAFWENEVTLGRRLTELSPTFRDGYLVLGNALSDRGAKAEAVAVFRKALRTWPDDTVLHYNLGLDLKSMGMIEEAEREFDTVLRLKSTNRYP